MKQQPVYTGSIRGSPVRFFSPQTTDDMMPWVIADDLGRALGLPRQLRRALEKAAIAKPEVAKAVVTDRGRRIILGFQAVQGLMMALQQAAPGDVNYSTELHQEYVREVTAAAETLFPDLFDHDENGNFRVSSTSIARLLGENHEHVVQRIETAVAMDWHPGPLH